MDLNSFFSDIIIRIEKGINYISNKIELYSNMVYLAKKYRKKLYEIKNDPIPSEFLSKYRDGKLLDIREFKFPKKDSDFNAYKYITPKSKYETISVDGKIVYNNIIYQSRVLHDTLSRYRDLKYTIEKEERKIASELNKATGYDEQKRLSFEMKVVLDEKERILKNYNHYAYVVSSILEDSQKLLKLYIKHWQDIETEKKFKDK